MCVCMRLLVWYVCARVSGCSFVYTFVYADVYVGVYVGVYAHVSALGRWVCVWLGVECGLRAWRCRVTVATLVCRYHYVRLRWRCAVLTHHQSLP